MSFRYDEQLKNQDGYRRDIYNLIVADEPYRFDRKNVIANTAIFEYTAEFLKKQFIRFGEDEREQLTKLPTLFCSYDSEFITLAEIRNIEFLPTVTFFKVDNWNKEVGGFGCEKAIILEFSDVLNIGKATDIHELQEVHWAVKEGDLIEVCKRIVERS